MYIILFVSNFIQVCPPLLDLAGSASQAGRVRRLLLLSCLLQLVACGKAGETCEQYALESGQSLSIEYRNTRDEAVYLVTANCGVAEFPSGIDGHTTRIGGCNCACDEVIDGMRDGWSCDCSEGGGCSEHSIQRIEPGGGYSVQTELLDYREELMPASCSASAGPEQVRCFSGVEFVPGTLPLRTRLVQPGECVDDELNCACPVGETSCALQSVGLVYELEEIVERALEWSASGASVVIEL